MTRMLNRSRLLVKAAWAFLFRMLIAWVRIGDRLTGPDLLFWFLSPLFVVDVLRRLTDYPSFKRLRDGLPAEWRREGSFSHYLHMIRVWHEALATSLLYDRLSSPAWASRITVSGTPPNELPGWGQRPVIVAFVHTGAFSLLRYGMRARGIPTASLVAGLPRVIVIHAETIRRAGDTLHGMGDVPHTFMGPKALREALHFLRPGHALTVALDGAKGPDLIPCDAGGLILHVKDGAVRLAQRTNALLLPASVQRKGPFRFEFRFGPPVPEHLLQSDDTTEALQYLVRELWKDLNWSTLEALAPEKTRARSRWP